MAVDRGEAVLGAIGMQEILIILVVGIIVFGAAKMPGIARSLGSGMRQYKKFRDGIKGGVDLDKWVDGDPSQDERPPQSRREPGAYEPSGGPLGQGYSSGGQYDARGAYGYSQTSSPGPQNADPRDGQSNGDDIRETD